MRRREGANLLKRIFRYLSAITILAAGGAGLLFLYTSRPQAVPAMPIEEAWPVATITAESENTSPTMTLFGQIQSPNLARLSAALSADVQSVEVKAGDWVDQDTVLVRLDSRSARLRLRQTRAEVNEFQAQLKIESERARTDRQSLQHEEDLLELTISSVERAKDLASQNLGSHSQLDATRADKLQREIALEQRRSSLRNHQARLAQIKARLQKAEALRDQAALDVEQTEIRAPFAGRVTDVAVAAGARVRVGDGTVTLFDPKHLEVRAQVPTRFLPTLRQGLGSNMPLAARLNIDGQDLRAYLHRLAGQVKTGQGGLDALFRIVQAPQWLRLGRVVRLTVALNPVSDAYALPIQALYDQDRIFTIKAGRLAGLHVVRVGERRNETGETFIIVRSRELRPGVQVVVTQLPNATSGLPVRAVDKQ